MDRRRVLLVVAAVIAALGTLLVVLYVRGADDRANDKFNAVRVLTVVKQINPGETVDAAQAAGKIELGSVAEGQRLLGALDSLSPIQGQIAQTTLYPGEQVVGAKFATTVASGTGLTMPKGSIAISLNLTDTGRVAGFVNPGAKVAIFLTTPAFTRLLLNNIEVIAVGATAVVPTTTTDASGNQTVEQLPRTLFTVGVTQAQAEKILYATQGGAGGGIVSFALLNDDSQVRPGPGTSTDNLFK